MGHIKLRYMLEQLEQKRGCQLIAESLKKQRQKDESYSYLSFLLQSKQPKVLGAKRGQEDRAVCLTFLDLYE